MVDSRVNPTDVRDGQFVYSTGRQEDGIADRAVPRSWMTGVAQDQTGSDRYPTNVPVTASAEPGRSVNND